MMLPSRLGCPLSLKTPNMGNPGYKRYLDTSPGVPIQDVIWDISPIGAQANERTGYPTQKPLALYERIIRAGSNPDRPRPVRGMRDDMRSRRMSGALLDRHRPE